VNLIPGKYRRILPYIVDQWPILAGILLMTALASGLAALQPWPVKILVDYALLQRDLPAALAAFFESAGWAGSAVVLIILAGAASVLLYLCNAALGAALSWAWSVAGRRMVYSLATDFYGRVLRLSLGFHNRTSAGEFLSRLTYDTWCVNTLTGQLFSPLAQLFTLATIGFIAWNMNPRLALISLSAAPLLAVASLRFGELLMRRAKDKREAETRLLSFVQQVIASVPLVHAFNTSNSNRKQFEALASEAVRFEQRSAPTDAAYALIAGLLTTMGTALVLFFGGLEVLAGTLSLGSLLVFLAYMRTMQKGAEGLLKTYSRLKPIEASIDRVIEILEAEDDAPGDLPGARPLEIAAARHPEIRYENVTFGYDPDSPVLHGVNLHVRAGEKVAFIGATGAGKSTIASLLPRLYDPWTGRITIGGEDIRNFHIDSLRAQISVVLQEPFLFAGTIAENIAYGRPDASRAEIEAAARIAKADAFIRRCPDGLDTRVGERGATLSGGEKQRLGIARALLKNAPILILDEPTSALDSQTESEFMEALDRLMEGRTVLIISHRLSTIQKVDRVVVIDSGRIVESGTPSQLLQAGGYYSRIHASHLGTVEEAMA
jgi:ATP-binding cassette, subfamily B, bacterial